MYDKEKNNRIIDEYDFFSSACSSMDCTGLIPAQPRDRAEWEYYYELYPFGVPNMLEENE